MTTNRASDLANPIDSPHVQGLRIVRAEPRLGRREVLREILKGKIDGAQVKINPKTDLWYGAYEDTSAMNFNDRRGGYQCRHQIYAVSSAMVPIEIKQAL